MNSEAVISTIRDYISQFKGNIKFDNSGNRYNINIRAESLFLPVLRIIYDCPNLENLNLSQESNFPSIDLGDSKKRIAIQVTSTKTSSKLEDSIKKFLRHGLQSQYDRLIFFILQDKQKTYTDKSLCEQIQRLNDKWAEIGSFNISNDINDLNYLSKRLNKLSSEDLRTIQKVFQLELSSGMGCNLYQPHHSGNKENLTLEVFGRNKEKEEICNSKEDFIIVGEPRSGKSYFLSSFTGQDTWYLNVKNINEPFLFEEIKLFRPKVILIDDLEINPQILDLLSEIRNNQNLEFRIIATCIEDENIHSQINSLDTNPKKIKLERLNQRQIAELLKNSLKFLGYQRHLYFENMILHQSLGLPGLAQTLLEASIYKNPKEVYSGKAFIDFFVAQVINNQLLDKQNLQKAKYILAVISLGGKYGISIINASKIIGCSTFELNSIVLALKPCGVLFKKNSQYIVRPKTFRTALLREILFDTTSQEEILQMLKYFISPAETLNQLLDAKYHGAKITTDFLISLLEDSGTEKLWEFYYYIQPNQIESCLEKYPYTFSSAIRPGLNFCPDQIIPKLLKEAIGDNRPINAYSDHPIRILQDWIRGNRDTYQDTIQRRKKLLSALLQWKLTEREFSTAIKAINLLLDTKLEFIENEPGDMGTGYLYFGILPKELVYEVNSLWNEILKLLSNFPVEEVIKIEESVNQWLYPYSQGNAIEDTQYEYMREKGVYYIKEILELFTNHSLIIYYFVEKLSELDITIEYDFDPVVKTLYPKYFYKRNEIQQDYKDFDVLVNSWINFDPEKFASKIQQFEADFELIPRSEHYSLALKLCQQIADRVDNPILWAKELYDKKLNHYLFIAFLKQAIIKDNGDWKNFLYDYLENENNIFPITQIVFTQKTIPNEIVDKCIDKIHPDQAKALKYLCIQEEISCKVMMKLVIQGNNDIQEAAVIGEFIHKPEGKIRKPLKELFEEKICKIKSGDYHLEIILDKNPHLRLEWLKNNFKSDELFTPHELERLIENTIPKLNQDERKELIQFICNIHPEYRVADEWIFLLIDNDISLFNYLLSIDKEKKYLLVPLRKLPTEANWLEMAVIAFTAGFKKEEIISSCFTNNRTQDSWGPVSNQFLPLIESFSQLKTDEDPFVSELGSMGLDLVKQKQQFWEKTETEKDVFGFDELH